MFSVGNCVRNGAGIALRVLFRDPSGVEAERCFAVAASAGGDPDVMASDVLTGFKDACSDIADAHGLTMQDQGLSGVWIPQGGMAIETVLLGIGGDDVVDDLASALSEDISSRLPCPVKLSVSSDPEDLAGLALAMTLARRRSP